MLPEETIQEILQISSMFDRYALSPGKPVGDAFHVILNHVPNEEAIIASHKYLKERTNRDTLRTALDECIIAPSHDSLEKAIYEFTHTEKQLGYHRKYAQASLGLASMNHKGKKMNARTKQEAAAKAVQTMRHRVLAKVLLNLTFTPFFDSTFTITKLEKLKMGHIEEFFRIVHALKLDDKYISLSQKLAGTLEPSPVDIVLLHLLETHHPTLLTQVYIPSKKPEKYSSSHEPSQTLDPPVFEHSDNGSKNESEHIFETGSESVASSETELENPIGLKEVTSEARQICFGPEGN